MTRYTAEMPWGGETIEIEADLTQASATIYTEDADGEWQPTQWQTADAQHDVRHAFALVLSEQPRDWYATDDDDRDGEAIIAEIVGDLEIESDEDQEDHR